MSLALETRCSEVERKLIKRGAAGTDQRVHRVNAYNRGFLLIICFKKGYVKKG